MTEDDAIACDMEIYALSQAADALNRMVSDPATRGYILANIARIGNAWVSLGNIVALARQKESA